MRLNHFSGENTNQHFAVDDWKKVIFADEFSFRFVVVNRMWYCMTGDKQEVVGIFNSGSICCSRAGELH